VRYQTALHSEVTVFERYLLKRSAIIVKKKQLVKSFLESFEKLSSSIGERLKEMALLYLGGV
jgi:hypothetical protein